MKMRVPVTGKAGWAPGSGTRNKDGRRAGGAGGAQRSRQRTMRSGRAERGEQTRTARSERNACAAIKTEDDAQWAGGDRRADKDGAQRAERMRGDQDTARCAVGGRSAASGQGRAASGTRAQPLRQRTARGERTRTARSEWNISSGKSCCVWRIGKMGAPWGWYGVEECI